MNLNLISKTSNFSCAKPNVNELEQIILLMKRLKWALILTKYPRYLFYACQEKVNLQKNIVVVQKAVGSFKNELSCIVFPWEY